MLINEKTIIYIACPANHVTGGSETLHQLAFKLKNKGFNVYMHYYGQKKNEEVHIPNKFQKYSISYVMKVEDKKENILILPETKTMLLYKYLKIQKVIWWLSVDFYKVCFIKNKVEQKIQKYDGNKFYLKPLLYIWYFRKIERKRQLEFKKDPNINNYFHLYNCQYCLDFLLENGVEVANTEYLCGPISSEYFNNKIEIKQKKDIVIYNPKKGMHFTEKIINYVNQVDGNIQFIPLENMNTEQIIDLLKYSKIYIDFGFFPGPERIPREAVLNYCNIITSTLGSARNDIDVPIPRKNKFSVDIANISIIGDHIISMIENYESQISDFDEYREKVRKQIELFDLNIDKIFKIKE